MEVISFIHSFIPYIHSFISYIQSFIHPVHSFVRSFVRSFIPFVKRFFPSIQHFCKIASIIFEFIQFIWLTSASHLPIHPSIHPNHPSKSPIQITHPNHPSKSPIQITHPNHPSESSTQLHWASIHPSPPPSITSSSSPSIITFS